MNEEDILRRRFGNETPFLVPDNYFSNVAEDIMKLIPQDKTSNARHAKLHSLWKRVAVAASVAVFIAAATIALHKNQQDIEPLPRSMSTALQGTHSETTALELMADYAILDNEDFYVYLADN